MFLLFQLDSLFSILSFVGARSLLLLLERKRGTPKHLGPIWFENISKLKTQFSFLISYYSILKHISYLIIYFSLNLVQLLFGSSFRVISHFLKSNFLWPSGTHTVLVRMVFFFPAYVLSLLISFHFSSQIKDPFLGGFMGWDRWVYVLFMVALGLWVKIGVVMGCIWWHTPWWLLVFVAVVVGFMS